MKVLFSIKPEFVSEIFSGTKKFEYRKSIFKDPNVETMVIYATMPVGKIIGECKIGKILQGSPNDVWEMTHKNSGIKKDFFDSYFKGRSKAYAIELKETSLYVKPRYLIDVQGTSIPPQSFRYIK